MKDMKIGKKLILSFIIIAVLGSSAGITGLSVTRNLDNSYTRALLENDSAQRDIGRFNTTLNRETALVRDIIYLNGADERKSARQKLNENIQKMDDLLEALKKICDTPEELQQYAVIDENLSRYLQVQDRLSELSLQQKSDEALELFRIEAEPLLNTCMEAADSLADMNVTISSDVSDGLSGQAGYSMIFVLVSIIINLVLSIIFGIRISHSISRPIEEMESAAKEMAEGRLKASVHYHSKNELGVLSDCIRTMIERISYYMEKINDTIRQLADGDLDMEYREDFLGEFRTVQMSIRELAASLNNTLGQINQSADQVSAGSDQVSCGAQSLAQGAAEQASSAEELAAAINEISSKVSSTSQNAQVAREQAMQAGEAITLCNQRMQKMLASMDDITQGSVKIGEIIKSIEDIAFQTNILALNAAVEAARAGAAGKGFAVVAEEVRNLAGKSAEASQNTSVLIAGSMEAVKKGTVIANETARSLTEVIENARAATETVDIIAVEAEEQADSILQITQGIDEISSVIQTNSATAQESAAASEELSGQAQVLKDLAGQFQLKPEE